MRRLKDAHLEHVFINLSSLAEHAIQAPHFDGRNLRVE